MPPAAPPGEGENGGRDHSYLDKDYLKLFHANPETSPTSLSRQLQQDDRHQRVVLHFCDRLIDLS